MKLPDKIKGIHKIRDFQICRLWLQDACTTEEIAEKVGLTERRIRQILRTNSIFLRVDKDFEKAKRIHILQAAIKNSQPSKKDRADLVEQLRREIEGDKPLIDKSINIKITKEEAIDRTNRLREIFSDNSV